MTRHHAPLPAYSHMTAAPVLPAVLLVIEGIAGIGLPASRGMPRDIFVAFPDGTAISWWLAPETCWRKPTGSKMFPGASPPEPPEAVARQLDGAVIGLRVVAREAKATKKYLDRLFAAGGRERLFDVEEFDAVAMAVRMPSITFGTLPGVMENLSQSKEAVVAAQTASAFLQLAAKNFKANAGSFAKAEP